MANCLDQIVMKVTEVDDKTLDRQTLVLKSLPKDMTTDHLFDFFSTFGKLQGVRIIHIHGSDSFGFVKYQKPEVCARVLKMEYHTIAGRQISVEVAHECHQDEVTASGYLPIESTNLIGTKLMDLNDDCLREILARVTVMELCSFLELSRNLNYNHYIRLQEITVETFARKYPVCDLNKVVPSVDEALRLLENFGPLISDLTARYSDEDGVRIIKLIIQHCSKTLESLSLSDFCFHETEQHAVFQKLETLDIHDCDFSGATDLFANCKSLIALDVHNRTWSQPNEAILQHTFPKLKMFTLDDESMGNESLDDESLDDESLDDESLENESMDNESLDKQNSDSEICKNFILRHKKLKIIRLASWFDLDLLPVIAANCSGLTKLYMYKYRYENPAEYENAVECVSNLKHLEELHIHFDPDALRFIRQLRHLQSLKHLTLRYVRCTPEIVSALTQLKMLETLKLQRCEEFTNFNPVAELCRLKALSIEAFENVDFDLVYMVSRLTDLEKLDFDRAMDFSIDKRMYGRIVKARLKAGSAHHTLQIRCNGVKTVFPS